MTGRGVSDDDMPIFPWSSRGDVPPVGDPAFDALLAGHLRPGDTAEGLRPVAEAIAALNAAPVTSELAAEASARAVFRAAGQPGQPVRSRRRRRPLLTALRSARLAVAAAAAVTLGGTAAAAYAGALPAPAQKFAHDIIGAPAHRGGHAARSPASVVPGATDHGGSGLCTAACARTARPGTAPAATPSGPASAHPAGQAHGHSKGSPHPTGGPSGDSKGNSGGQPNGGSGGQSNGNSGGQPNGGSGGQSNGGSPGHARGKSSAPRVDQPVTGPTGGPPGQIVGQPPGHSAAEPATQPDVTTTAIPNH
jgi:uncharacterized membrane protein YgcG